MKDIEINTVTIDSIKRTVDTLSKKIGAPAYLLPTYDISEQTGRPHIEIDGDDYHFVVAERGEEIERRTTHDVYDILYWIFAGITFSLATDYEVKHRVLGRDFRRLLFRKQEEILGILDEDWKRRLQEEHRQILQVHPFDDNT